MRGREGEREREREKEREKEKLTAGADGDAVSVTGSFNLGHSEGKVVGSCSDFSDFTFSSCNPHLR